MNRVLLDNVMVGNPDQTEARRKVLRVHPGDNVLVALNSLKAGEKVSAPDGVISLVSSIPAKHKFATAHLATGDAIAMYGISIGRAVEPIRQGELLTTRNVQHYAAAVKGKSSAREWTAPDVSHWRQRTFPGYQRADGQVGTRNYWLVIPLVFCENRNVAVLKQAFEEELGYAPPQVYRNQVAELVELYKEGKFEEANWHWEQKAVAGGRRRVFHNV